MFISIGEIQWTSKKLFNSFLTRYLLKVSVWDYCSDLNGTPIKEIGDLLRILEEENGELTLLGNHPEYGDIYIVVDMGSDTTYKTVSPGEGNFKAMEAVYALIP